MKNTTKTSVSSNYSNISGSSVSSIFIIIAFLAMTLFTSFFVSCSSDSGDKTITEYSLTDIYGYTFECSFTSSSGTALSPAITIYDADRLDWNMSSSNMGNKQYVYSAVQTAVNNWTTYWYSGNTKDEALALKTAGDTSKASMTVRLGIDSLSQVTCLVKSAKDGAGDSMGTVPLSMQKTSAAKKTEPTVWAGTSETITDVTITIPSTAVSAEWPESETKTYSGTFVYLVPAVSTTGKGETGDSSTPSVSVTKTENNTVTIKNVRMHVSSPMEMTLMPFDVTEVSVKKDGETYYLSKDSFSSQTSDYTEDSDGKKLTGYKITGSSLTGKLENDVLVLRFVFKPGTMPFEMTEVFTSAN